MARQLLMKSDNSHKDTKGKNVDYHILCIDDDAEFLTRLKFELGKSYQCSTAANLRDGLQIIQRETVDLVLMDIGLSNEDGIEGLRQIKGFDSSIDVVMVTGCKDPGSVVRAIRAGASDYICKPFEQENLVATIEKLQRVRQMRNRHDTLIENLKTLENVIHNLVIMAQNGTIGVEDLPDWAGKKQATQQFDFNRGKSLSLKDCIQMAEKTYIENVLKTMKGNKSKTAKKLNMSRSTLHIKLKELGVE